jgi:hypothetical protein
MNMKKLIATLAALSAAGSAHADTTFGPPVRDSGSCYVLSTYNQTPKWAWITVYDLAKVRHLDYGWVAPFTKREWRSGRYACGSYYYVRGEVKAAEGPNPPAGGGNIFDTTVQAHFLSFSPGSATGSVVYLKTKVNTAYVDQPPGTWSYDNRSFWWDVDNSTPSAAKVTRMYDNTTLHNNMASAAVFTITGTNPVRHPAQSVCVPAGKDPYGGPQLLLGAYHVTAGTYAACDGSWTGGAGQPIATVQGDFIAGDDHGDINITAGSTITFSRDQ